MAAAMQQQQPPQQHQHQQQTTQSANKEAFNHHQYHLHHSAIVHHHPQYPAVQETPSPSPLQPESYYHNHQQPHQNLLGSTAQEHLQQHYSTSYQYNNHQHPLTNNHFRYQQSFQQHQQHQSQPTEHQLYKLHNQGREELQQLDEQSSLDNCSSDNNKTGAPPTVLTELSSSKLSEPSKQLGEEENLLQVEIFEKKRKRPVTSEVYDEQQEQEQYSWCQQRLKSVQVTDQSNYPSASPYLSTNTVATTNYEETTSTDELYYKQLPAATYESPVAHITSSTHYLSAGHEPCIVSPPQPEQVRTGSGKQQSSSGGEFNQLRVLEMRKEKSRDAARSRRSKENHEFYELAKLLPLPAAITSQLDFLDKASIIRLTISFLKLRQFSVNGHPPWAPDFTTLGSVNPYSSQHYVTNNDTSLVASSKPISESTQHEQSPSTGRLYSSSSINQPEPYSTAAEQAFSLRSPTTDQLTTPNQTTYHQHQLDNQDKPCTQLKNSANLFDIHLGTHILQSLDGFAFAIGRDGRFLYISETVSMYLGLSQVEMTGSSVFDYTHQQDHEELAKQLGIPFTCSTPSATSSSQSASDNLEPPNTCDSPAPASVHSQYSAASNETLIDDYINNNDNTTSLKRSKLHQHSHSNHQLTGARASLSAGRLVKRSKVNQRGQSTSGHFSNNRYTSFNQGTSSQQHKDTSEATGAGEVGQAACSQMGASEDPLVRQFCIRMKSTLTKRGCQHFKSSGYRVVHVVAHLRSFQSNDHGHLMDPLDEATSTGNLMNSKQTRGRRAPKTTTKTVVTREQSTSNQSNNIKMNNTANSDTSSAMSDINNGSIPAKQKIIGMVAVAIALPPPSINELRLESDTFVFKLAPDLRITHIEPRITELLNYPVEMMAGRSLYSLVHPADVMQLQKCHKELLKKGQIMSAYYRLLARNGGYLWIQTCATLICNSSIGAAPNHGSSSITAASPASLMSSPAIQEQFHHQTPGTNKHLQVAPGNYQLQPALFNSVDPLHYSTSASHTTGKMIQSSSMNNSYQEVGHQESDQCVIFVNYMITNVMESTVIMDICQGAHPVQNPVPFSGTSGQQAGASVLFASPASASSCSAPPCSNGLIKSNSSTGFSSYVSPSSTPTETTQLNHSGSPTRSRQFEVSGREKLCSGKIKGMAGTRLRNAEYRLKHHNKTGDEIGAAELLDSSSKSVSSNAFDLTNINAHHYPQQHQNTSSSSALYTGYPQQIQTASGGVNLALSGAASSKALIEESPTGASWQHQSSIASRGLNNESLSVYGEAAVAAAAARQVTGNNHYPAINHSIYKAAFGLDVNTVTSNGGYQQSGTVYPQVNNGTAAGTYQQVTGATPQATSTATTWDTATAAAALASANQYQQQQHHHHHHHQPSAAHHHQHHQTQMSHHPLSSYAHHHHHHLEPHHHLETAHSQALSSAAAAAAAAVAVNHHSTTAGNNYYNYCGYYGNKFI